MRTNRLQQQTENQIKALEAQKKNQSKEVVVEKGENEKKNDWIIIDLYGISIKQSLR